MWEYYCKTCGKTYSKDEIDLREGSYQGDWEEYHIACDSKVEARLKP
jgi:hypothetical protein